MSMISGKSSLLTMERRHPYIVAHSQFLAGTITKAQAIGMIARDREFIAETELAGDIGPEAVLEVARKVVENVWLPRLVKNTAKGLTSAHLGA